MFWYCFRERERILDLFELCCGTRMHTRYFQAGGLAEDIPRGFFPECRAFTERMPGAVDEYETMLNRNAIWLERTKGLGLLSAADALALGQSGPVLRASGVDWDLRKNQPYLAYDEVDFRVPVYYNGDVYDRYRVHMVEMRESTRIVAQALDRLEEMVGEPWIVDDRRFVLPPRHELHTSMEWLIHHFKIVTEGYRVPEGEVYVPTESPRGEFGCYVVSSGGPKPWRVKFRAPSFVALEATATCMSRCARRGPDRDRRLARHGHGRGGPMTTFYDEVQEIKAQYRRSARPSFPRSASRRSGTAAGCRRRRCSEVADALELTRRKSRRWRPSTTCSTWSPSASTWSRCARTSPARSSGRSRCWRHSRASSGSRPARRRRTGSSRCARSSAPAAAAGGRRRRGRPLPDPVKPEDVPQIVEGVRSGN